MKDPCTVAKMAGVVVVRGNLCCGSTCNALIAVKHDIRFGVNRHSIGPLPCDMQA